MEYSVDYLPDKNIVCIKMTGQIKLHIAEQYSKDAIKLAHQYNALGFYLTTQKQQYKAESAKII